MSTRTAPPVTSLRETTLSITAIPRVFPSEAMRLSAGHTDHCTVVNNTLYENDTSGTGSGEFQMQWNMADNIFANNIVYAGPRCLIALNKSQVEKNQPPATIDHNLYYCASGAAGEHMGRSFRHRDRIRQIC